MILRPTLADYKLIGFYTGKIIIGIGLLMLIPLATALIFGEWNPALDFTIGSLTALIAGFLLEIVCRTDKEMEWIHGLVIGAFSWLAATIIGAIPDYLSGHFGSYLDACFDLMSGYTTTGLFLLQDLDHVSNALNMWRHLLTYAGGQGIIVIALTFLIRGTAGAFMMYVGEGKEEKLLPNVIQTARAIWYVSLSYLAVGTLLLTAANIYEGMAPVRGLLQGMWVFMGAWSTGGFAPQSFNIFYYHSLLIEIITMVLFIVGSFNFALHWAVWTGNRREIYKNIETVTFTATLMVTLLLTVIGLMKVGIFTEAMPLFRKGFYQLVSGHTTTGYQTIFSRQFIIQWGELGVLAVIIAMALGASAASTAGGFKALRVGIVLKSLAAEVRRLMSPPSAIVAKTFHHVKEIMLTSEIAKSAMIIIVFYIFIYIAGAALGVYYGIPLTDALFESVSAGSNSGLSIGVTSPNLPVLMKVYYIYAMWVGRLEFFAIIAMGAMIIATVRGR